MPSPQLREFAKATLLRSCPPYRRMRDLAHDLGARIAALEHEMANARVEAARASAQALAEGHAASSTIARLIQDSADVRREASENAAAEAETTARLTDVCQQLAQLQADTARKSEALGRPRIQITRGDQQGTIDPVWFDQFPFKQNDVLAVIPAETASRLPTTWGDVNVPVAPGHAIRVPPVWASHAAMGLDIPAHLISLTGAGPETLESIGQAHIRLYDRHIGLYPGMTIIDLGCGIGRDAMQLLDFLNDDGRYIGVDVTRDSVVWCQANITRLRPNITFHHVDAFSELYNPHGAGTSMDMRLPAEDGTVDRIVLASVFTHLLESEVLHYLQEFARVLKPGGLVYATFFLFSPEAIASAATKGNTNWAATFAHDYGGGVYGNDPDYPRGAVAFTAEAMGRLIGQAGLALDRPYLKGWWSGLHEEADDGQDVAILVKPS